MNILKEYMNTESLLSLGQKFRDLLEFSVVDNRSYSRKVRTKKNYQRMLDKISPYVPEFLIKRLKECTKF
jgi:hypothetical protein